jgi:sec-independent protein translocase protein TatA
MAGYLPPIAFVSMPGGGEWIVILVIALLIFGRRLPEVARSLGKSLNEFKRGMREFQDSANEVASDVHKATNDVMAETDGNTTTYGATSEADAYYGGNDSTSEGQYTAETGEPGYDQTTTADSYQTDSGSPTQDPALGVPAQSTDPEPPDAKRPDSPDSYEPMA